MSGVRNLVDDIIVWGRDENEHDDNLERVCKRLAECGLTATIQEYRAEQLVFFGLKITKDGVAPNDSSVGDLIKAPPPPTFGELASFLGLTVYLSRHIPDLATTAAPLWDLRVQKGRGKSFEWKEEHDRVMNKIKQTISTKALAYFDVAWHTEVYVDASPKGLGAVCLQINPDDNRDRRVITS